MKTIGLIDGDIFTYEIASAAETATDWGDGLWTLHAEAGPAIARLDDRMEQLKDATDSDELIVCLTDKENWRTGVLPTYKGNRLGVRRPMILNLLKQHLIDNYKTYIKPTLEADDVLGILASWPKLKGKKIIITKDKDLQTIAGYHFQSNHPERGVFEVTPEEADKFHLMQALAGDVTDGYSGCPNVGMETARDIVENLTGWEQYEHTFKSGPRKDTTENRWRKVEKESVWEAIVSNYAKAGLGEEEALTQARVARICRASDYDFKNKKVILWTPQ